MIEAAGGALKARVNLSFPAKCEGFVRREKRDFWRSAPFFRSFFGEAKKGHAVAY